ncbi:MAG: hypothetical protein M1831_000533 [Alyxoria varia]|nr:MAG: hypothetical protein M1831_000533 [Alyxoria varia]
MVPTPLPAGANGEPADAGEAIFAGITHDIEQHGGTNCPLSSTDIRRITHLISGSADFPAYYDAVEAYIHVVKPLWVEQSLLKKRAPNPRQFSPDPDLFLTDVTITFADDIPTGDKDAIIAGSLAMGAQYSAALTKACTHLVTLSIHRPQAKLVLDKKLSTKIVLPHWFDKCFLLGKKLDEHLYSLPDPPCLKPGGGVRKLEDSEGTEGPLSGACLLEPSFTPPASPSKHRRGLTVFRNHAIHLSQDLDITPHLQHSIRDMIHNGGGVVVESLAEADTLICQYRDRSLFRQAVTDGKDAGNLNWLYALIKNNKWTSPLRRLLHTPIPNGGIPGFERFKITISNYTGEARVYLESLTRAAGGNFTRTMTQENTHLVTAHMNGEKVEAANEWNVQIVNHLWLEESYARLQIQPMRPESKYTKFPSKTNLGEVIGQTSIDRERLVRCYSNSLVNPKKPKGSALEAVDSNSHTPDRSAHGDPNTDAPTPSSASSKENSTMLQSGGRGAKDRALSKLHKMAPDIALFEKESKRRGGVIYGGRRANDPDRVVSDPIPTSGSHKRSSSVNVPSSEGTGEVAEVDERAPKKRQRRGKKTHEIKYRFVVTQRDHFEWKQEQSRSLRDIGMREIDNVPENEQFDVLVAPKVLKTPNFLAAVAAGAIIVRPDWIKHAMDSDIAPDPKNYLLDDKCPGGVNIQTALANSLENKHKGGLFKGWTIYFTERDRVRLDSMAKVVKRNRGGCIPYHGRATKPPTRASLKEEGARLFLVSSSSKEDKALWPKFREMALQAGYQPLIKQPDWLMNVALTQDLQLWEDEYGLS